MEESDLYKVKDSFMEDCDIKSDLILDNMVQAPFFTVLIPTYQREDTLAVTVQSAIDQIGEDDYEILVIDNDSDGINGRTRKFLTELNCNKLSYYVNRENLGMVGNWNRGVILSRGKYIVMIHDDDLLSPYCLKSLRQAIMENQNPGLIGVNAKTFHSSALPEFSNPEKLSYRKVTKRSFFFGRYINIAGMTMRKDLICDIGGFNREYYPASDTAFIYQGLIHSRVINIENTLAGYRVENNTSLSVNTMQNIIFMMEKIRRNIAEYESFAKWWMKLFDAEYLYYYIDCANKTWSMNLNYQELFPMLGINRRYINPIKVRFMGYLQRLEYRFLGKSELG